jgi:hypothetical protein
MQGELIDVQARAQESPQRRLTKIADGIIDLIDIAERVAIIAPKVGLLGGNRVVRVNPHDPVAVSKAKAAIADRHAAMSERHPESWPKSIHRLAAKRIAAIERYLALRYGRFVPDDDAGRHDLVILANHVAQNRHDRHTKVLRSIRVWAPWMAPTEAEAIAGKVLEKPRKYTAKTLGILLRLTREEQIAGNIETIRPIDRTDADVRDDKSARTESQNEPSGRRISSVAPVGDRNQKAPGRGIFRESQGPPITGARRQREAQTVSGVRDAARSECRTGDRAPRRAD